MPPNTALSRKVKMGNMATLLLLLLVLCHGVATFTTMGFYRGERGDEGTSTHSSRVFLMSKSKSVVRTDAGEMRVFRSYGGGRNLERSIHIGLINMEPKSLFIPQYLDSNMVMFIRRGEAKLGFMYEDELAERRLKIGDVYVIPAGTPFYLVNIGEGQRLHIACSIEPTERFGGDTFHSFYIGGGANPESVLFGFDPVILETAFNASRRDVERIFGSEIEGPMVYVDDSHPPSLWTKFLQMKNEEKAQHLKKMVGGQHHAQEEEGEEEQQTSWSWRKVLRTVFGEENKKDGEFKGRSGDSPDSYNLYDKKTDFRNDYGQSTALDGDEYHPLRIPDVGVYHVNLTAGSMMAPHVNPRATEYGIVLKGTGTVHVVFPNGTSAMKAGVREGDVFFVPRFFPFCHVASRSGPLEFFGFTSSAARTRPLFLAGRASLLSAMMGPELAAAFGVAEDTMRRVVSAQDDDVIFPSTWAAPGDVEEREEGEREGERPRGEESEGEERGERERKPKVVPNGVKGLARDLV